MVIYIYQSHDQYIYHMIGVPTKDLIEKEEEKIFIQNMKELIILNITS